MTAKVAFTHAGLVVACVGSVYLLVADLVLGLFMSTSDAAADGPHQPVRATGGVRRAPMTMPGAAGGPKPADRTRIAKPAD